jgi:hypothetical protein
MSAAHLLRDEQPESTWTCKGCGVGQENDAGAMGQYMHEGKIVYAHLKCAKALGLIAIDQWMEAGE